MTTNEFFFPIIEKGITKNILPNRMPTIIVEYYIKADDLLLLTDHNNARTITLCLGCNIKPNQHSLKRKFNHIACLLEIYLNKVIVLQKALSNTKQRNAM